MFNPSFNPSPEKLIDIKTNQESLSEVSDKFIKEMSLQGFETRNNKDLKIENDGTLLFANSTMSRYKLEINGRSLPDSGYAIVQKCLRTRSLSNFLDRGLDFQFNSYFTMIGVLFGGKDPKNIVSLTLSFLVSQGLDINRVFIKTNQSVKNVNLCLMSVEEAKLIYGSESAAYYSWVYGIDGITGEGITFTYKSKEGKCRDLGNIICFIDDATYEIIGWESGFGLETLMAIKGDKQLFETHPIWDVVKFSESPDLKKVMDSVVSSIEIIRSGYIPGSKKQGYILRKFLMVIYQINKDLDLNIKDIALKYCNLLKYDNPEAISGQIESYLTDISISKSKNLASFKKFLKSNQGTNLSREEKIVVAKSSFSMEESEILDII